MAWIQIILIATQLHLSSPVEAHDFHIGITEINYSTSSKRYEVSIKIFTDDLEKSILESSNIALKLDSDKEHLKSDSLIQSYISSCFDLITSKNKNVEISYIGRETEMELTWVYLESEKTKPLKSLAVRNEIFFETFDDQTHLVHLRLGDSKQTLYLRDGNAEDTFTND